MSLDVGPSAAEVLDHPAGRIYPVIAEEVAKDQASGKSLTVGVARIRVTRPEGSG